MGKPVDVAEAAAAFTDGRIVAYINGNTLAMLAQIAPDEPPHGPGCRCASRRRSYGFIYPMSPKGTPTFMNTSAKASIIAAQSYQDSANRSFYLCNSLRELLDLYDSRKNPSP